MNTFGGSGYTIKNECHLTEHKCVVVHPKCTKSYVEGIYRYDYISIDNRLTEIHIECIDKEITEVTELPRLDKHLPANMTDVTILFEKMFANCKRLTDISLLESLPLTNVGSLASFFSECEKLHDIRVLSKWDVSKVERFDSMFCECSSIETFRTISKWNVSSAVSMTEMFFGTSATVDDIKDWRPRANCDVYHFLYEMHDDVDNDINIYCECPWIGICILTNRLDMEVTDTFPEFPSSTAREIYKSIVKYITPDLYKWIDDSKLKNESVKRRPAPGRRYRVINEPHCYNDEFTGDIILVDRAISASLETKRERYQKPSKRIRLETETGCFALHRRYYARILERIDK